MIWVYALSISVSISNSEVLLARELALLCDTRYAQSLESGCELLI